MSTPGAVPSSRSEAREVAPTQSVAAGGSSSVVRKWKAVAAVLVVIVLALAGTLAYTELSQSASPRELLRQTFTGTGCALAPWQGCSNAFSTVNLSGAAESPNDTIPITVLLTITNVSCAGNATTGSTRCLLYWFGYVGHIANAANTSLEFTTNSLRASFPSTRGDGAELIVMWLCEYYPHVGGAEGPYFNVSEQVETP
jgi:hypothetical protein